MILLSVMTYRVVLRFSSARMNATRAMNRKNAPRIVLADKLPTVGLTIDEKRHGSWRRGAPPRSKPRPLNANHGRERAGAGGATATACPPDKDMAGPSPAPI